jgi:hypothetical protein
VSTDLVRGRERRDSGHDVGLGPAPVDTEAGEHATAG